MSRFIISIFVLLIPFLSSRGETLRSIKERGVEYYVNGQIEQARACWQKVIDLYTPEMGADETDAYADAMNNMGHILSHAENSYVQAFRCLTRAHTIYASMGNWQDWAINSLNLADLYHIYEDSDNALELLLQSMRVAIKNNRWDTAVTAFSNACRMLYSCNTKQLLLVDSMQRELQTAVIPTSNPYANYAKALNRVCLHWRKQDYSTAALMADEARFLVPTNIDSAKIALGCLFLKAHAQRKAGQTAQPIATIKNILLLPDLPAGFRYEALMLMFDICKEKGEAERALQWLDEARGLEDSVIGNQRYSLLRNTEQALQAEDYEARVNQERRARERLWWWLWTAGAFIVVLTICGWVILRQNRSLHEKNRQLYENMQPYRPVTTDKAKPQQNEALMERIRQAVADEAWLSNPELTVQMLADQVGASARTVSETINAVTGENFSTLLARARVALACERLRNPATHNLTLEALGQSLGFRSRSNFAVMFRKITGLTLSEYRKMAEQ